MRGLLGLGLGLLTACGSADECSFPSQPPGAMTCRVPPASLGVSVDDFGRPLPADSRPDAIMCCTWPTPEGTAEGLCIRERDCAEVWVEFE